MYGRISVNLIAIHSFNCNIRLSLANQFSLIFLFFSPLPCFSSHWMEIERCSRTMYSTFTIFASEIENRNKINNAYREIGAQRCTSSSIELFDTIFV